MSDTPIANTRCACGCVDVPDHGPCSTPCKGANGRCVYCDHALECHKKNRRWQKEPR